MIGNWVDIFKRTIGLGVDGDAYQRVFVVNSTEQSRRTVVTETNYETEAIDGAIIAKSVNPITITLIDASLFTGKAITVKRNGAFNVTILPIMGQLVDEQSSLIIEENLTSYDLLSDGSKWVII